MDKCGSCKCYICGYSHCGRSLCRGEQKSTCQFSKKDCGKFVFDAEKLRDKLIPDKKEIGKKYNAFWQEEAADDGH